MDRETEQLVAGFLDGELDDNQADSLCRRLEASPDDRAEFLALAGQARAMEAMFRPAEGFSESVLAEIRARRDAGRFVGEVMARLPRRGPARRRLAVVAAAAAAVVLGVAAAIWLGGGRPCRVPPHAATPPVASAALTLASGWRIEPTGAAVFRAAATGRVRLDEGELLVESADLAEPSAARAPLTIETPVGAATATGTSFYIGTHQASKGATMKSKGTTMKTTRLTRVLVLSGVVTLASSLGSVSGGANELLAAEPGQAPVKVAVQANSDFALDLYARFAKQNAGKNMFFSPYSISSALAMTAEGARGETAAEMGKVLRFPEAARRVGDDAQLIPWRTALIHTGMAELNDRLAGGKSGGLDKAAEAAVRAEIARLTKEFMDLKSREQQLRKDKKWDEYVKVVEAAKEVYEKLADPMSKVDRYELRIANALWGEKTYPFLDSYIQTIHKFYNTGGIFEADFKESFPAERTRINDWIAEQTAGRIKDIIPELPPEEASLMRLILTNAIYFKGEWSVPFEEADTKDRSFGLGGDKSVQTPIMDARNLEVARYAAFNADGSFFKTPAMVQPGQKEGLYPDAKGFAVVELPYKGDDLSMVVVAPNSADGLAEIEAKLGTAHLDEWIGKLQKRKTNVLLPKFKLETDYKMGDTLKAMGMVRAFTDPLQPNGADFSGMCASKNPMDRLYIAKVLHKAFVEVNEKGTEAAAATAVMLAAGRSAPRSVPFVPTFKADRPFLFLIRDIQTGSILFMGRMMNPKP